MVWSSVSDETLMTINGLQFAAIIYLAVAMSRLANQVARLEGRNQERNHRDDRGDDPGDEP